MASTMPVKPCENGLKATLNTEQVLDDLEGLKKRLQAVLWPFASEAKLYRELAKRINATAKEFGVSGYSGDYIRQVSKGIKPCPYVLAKMIQHTRIDATPNTVFSPFEIPPGTVLDIQPRQCPTCGRWFIPRAWNHQYHHRSCRGKHT